MADEIPIIPKAGQLWVHTGNIVNWNRLKKKLTQLPAEELSECISSTLTSWLEHADKSALQYATSVECADEKFAEKILEDEREPLKVTVKVFLSIPSADEVEEAVEKACAELGVHHLEKVLLSLPEKQWSFDDLQRVWEKLENLVKCEKIYSIGVADLDKSQLEQLYEWATVKPCINQVNLESCCVMPAELTEYAKERDIRLLTHNDPKEILPEKKFQTLISTALTSRDADNWQPVWVVRYTVLFKCRGIVKAKGYIVKGSKDIKKKVLELYSHENKNISDWLEEQPAEL